MTPQSRVTQAQMQNALQQAHMERSKAFFDFWRMFVWWR